ncbi:MAG: hypothetical protein R3C10_04895 [Pirellulales bacterium]
MTTATRQTHPRRRRPSRKRVELSAPGRTLQAKHNKRAVQILTMQQRAARLLATEIDYIQHESFSEATPPLPAANDLPVHGERKSSSRLPVNMPAHLARLCEAPLLTAEQERQLFERMNYAKFLAHKLQAQDQRGRPGHGLDR